MLQSLGLRGDCTAEGRWIPGAENHRGAFAEGQACPGGPMTGTRLLSWRLQSAVGTAVPPQHPGSLEKGYLYGGFCPPL